jgi:hypothetical protein
VLSVDPLRTEHDFDLTQHLVTDIAPTIERRESMRWSRTPNRHRPDGRWLALRHQI